MKPDQTNGPGREAPRHDPKRDEAIPMVSSKKEKSAELGSPVQFRFEGAGIRILVHGSEPWFVAADVCRALQLASDRGSYTAHHEKLDADEKKQISREAVRNATPGFNPEVPNDVLTWVSGKAAEAQDPVMIERGPLAWIISESGLYTLMLRSREATTQGTLPHRFRRWVTREVIPSIRSTGQYEHPAVSSAASGNSSGDADHDEEDELSLGLREPGRYVVLVVPGRVPHVRRTRYEAILEEESALECQILCHALKLIECWWQKTEQIHSIGRDPREGFAFDRLEHAVLDGGHIAEQYLCVGRQKLRDKQT